MPPTQDLICYLVRVLPSDSSGEIGISKGSIYTIVTNTLEYSAWVVLLKPNQINTQESSSYLQARVQRDYNRLPRSFPGCGGVERCTRSNAENDRRG